MAEIIRTYEQSVGAMRFIGKKYHNSDRVNGTFGEKWHEWFENGWFEEIQKQPYEELKDVYDECEAQIGLVRGYGETFEYWIGLFMPENTIVPPGFEAIDFPKGYLGVCWVYGKENEVYMQETRCMKRLEEDGYIIVGDCFERYCRRFAPDEEGNVTLDICFYVEQRLYDSIEDAVDDMLDGSCRENALHFAAYLKENGLSPVPLPYVMCNGKTIGYKILYNGHYLGWILLEENNEWCFQVFNFLDFGRSVHSAEEDEDFKKAVYDHVKICQSPCHDTCWRAKDVKIFGKEFKSVCSQHSCDFVNPDGETIEYMKKLLEYSKETTPYAQQYHPNNI